jgi:Rieske Fe-S protein
MALDSTGTTTTTDSSEPGGLTRRRVLVGSTSEVPLNGGLIIEDPEPIVITQPADGEFLAFTAVCTHQGCTVATVEENVIRCGCHGSQYDASTGEVIGGPAPDPLAPIEINVEGDSISLA